MSSPAGMPPGLTPWQTQTPQPPPMAQNNESNEEGVSVRPMRLKVLYTFDDQNKTNCLARWPHVLNIQTVAMDETTSIGVIELKTCIQAIVQCSPELLSRLGQDYTVYAYDYSEYDNPLVGQGMLSWALAAASPTPGAPAQQSRQLITGRVCKNILGIFSNGVKETLEVKLRLVPVPTMLQSEYQNTMEKYRDISNVAPSGFDTNEWTSFLQSNPNVSQMATKIAPQNMGQRDGLSMEVVNQLLSPQLQQQQSTDPFNQINTGNQINDQGNNQSSTTTATKRKAASRPSSRASVKKPRGRPKGTATNGGNTSGYEDATDGDDGPAPKKRAKVTKADKNINTSLAQAPDSLRVAASTAGSLRLFRPIAVAPNTQPEAGSHLQEIPRAPTPVPHLPDQHFHRGRAPSQSGLRHDSVTPQVEQTQHRLSLFPPIDLNEDQLRCSIESAGPSPERNIPSPSDSLHDIGSSPPLMRTRPPSTIRSSPPCPSSPLLPEMPRTDSGFMSGSLEELFGEDDMMNQLDEKEIELPPHKNTQQVLSNFQMAHQEFAMQGTMLGPMEHFQMQTSAEQVKLVSNKKARAAISRAGSIMSEDGQVLPPVKAVKKRPGGRAASRVPAKIQAQKEPSQRPKSLTPTTDGQLDRPRSSNSQHPEQQRQQFPSENTQHPPYAMEYFDYSAGVAVPFAPAGQYVPSPQYPGPQQAQNTALQSNQNVSSQPRPRAPSQPSQPAQTTQRASPQPSQTTAPEAAPRPRPSSRTMVRTASMGSLTLPTIPASDPVLPPSNLHRSQTWSDAPHPATEAPMYDPNFVPDKVSFPDMSQMPTQPPMPPNNGLIPKKATIKDKLERAIENGEMPPFCMNCGAIQTSTWRRAWSQEMRGEPGYYEYSDEPGRVTAINVLTRDAAGKPTSFQLIKKFLLKEENQDNYNEFLLCNPCGIWMSKYKTQRPESKWEINALNGPRNRDGTGEKKRPAQRPSKPKNVQTMNYAVPTSDANFPPSDAYFPPSDANFLPSEAYLPQFDGMGPPEGVSPGDTTSQQQPSQRSQSQSDGQNRDSVPPQNDGQRRGSFPARKRINAMTSEAAPEALRRALRSSPARWQGTQNSPIDLEDDPLGSTRRLLFPSPRKDGSPKVLGEITTNVVTVATSFRSPKQSMIDVQDKENCPPAIEGDDVGAELLRLFEEEMGKDHARPSTPTGKSPSENPFETPTRPTPGHRPLTRSVSRSIRSARSAKSPGHLLMFTTTPTRTPGIRRSPRHHNGIFESPFTATLNQLMSEANNQNTSPARNGMELDFGSLPELPNIDHQNQNMDMNNFSLEDFFSTDVPMPSSPPRINFQLYEDPAAMNSINWDEFGKFDAKDLGKGDEVLVKQEDDEDQPRRKSDNNKAEERHS